MKNRIEIIDSIIEDLPDAYKDNVVEKVENVLSSLENKINNIRDLLDITDIDDLYRIKEAYKEANKLSLILY